MGRHAKNEIVANEESVKRKIKEGAGQKPAEWRLKGQPGLVLRTYPSGVGAFYAYYRQHGKRRKLRLGDFGPVPLRDALRRAREVHAAVDQGGDPALERASVKASMTFRELTETFMTDAGRSETTCTLYRDVLSRDAFPLFGDKPAAAVTDDDIFAMCRRIKARGTDRVAQLTKSAVGGVYRFGIRNGYVKSSPTKDVPNQQEGKSIRKKVPTDAEIAALWHAPEMSGRTSVAIKLIIRLAILTGQRRTEVAGAKVSEVKDGVWTIPAVDKRRKAAPSDGRRMKNGQEQRVYLSAQAAALFDEALRECSDGTYFFPSQGVRGKPDQKTRKPHIHGDSVTQAVRELCAKAGVEDVRIHDMRRAVTTFLGERDDVSGRTLDMIIHHKRSDDRDEDRTTAVTGTHYDMSKRAGQLRHAWQAWADHVDTLVTAGAATAGNGIIAPAVNLTGCGALARTS